MTRRQDGVLRRPRTIAPVERNDRSWRWDAGLGVVMIMALVAPL